MDKEQNVLIEQVKDEAKAIFKGDYSGHDISHTMRVYSLALEIAKSEKADLFRVALTALLHDADDCKVTGKDDESLENAVGILGKIGLEEDVKQRICEDIKNLSFRGSGKTVPASMEGKIVQDADRLDAMGAVGIARAFAYAGNKNLPLYDYAGDAGLDNPGRDSAVGHFYKKLLKLKDFMNTETAKKMAEERHRFMLDFLDRLNTEIGAE